MAPRRLLPAVAALLAGLVALRLELGVLVWTTAVLALAIAPGVGPRGRRSATVLGLAAIGTFPRWMLDWRLPPGDAGDSLVLLTLVVPSAVLVAWCAARALFPVHAPPTPPIRKRSMVGLVAIAAVLGATPVVAERVAAPEVVFHVPPQVVDLESCETPRGSFGQLMMSIDDWGPNGDEAVGCAFPPLEGPGFVVARECTVLGKTSQVRTCNLRFTPSAPGATSALLLLDEDVVGPFSFEGTMGSGTDPAEVRAGALGPITVSHDRYRDAWTVRSRDSELRVAANGVLLGGVARLDAQRAVFFAMAGWLVVGVVALLAMAGQRIRDGRLARLPEGEVRGGWLALDGEARVARVADVADGVYLVRWNKPGVVYRDAGDADLIDQSRASIRASRGLRERLAGLALVGAAMTWLVPLAARALGHAL